MVVRLVLGLLSIGILGVAGFIVALTQPLVRSSAGKLLNVTVDPEHLADHVRALTALGPRHFARPEVLDAAAAYIGEAFRGAGVEPTEQALAGGRYRNLIASFGPMSQSEAPRIVVGAHYDTVARS